MIFALPREKKKHALFNIARLLGNLALQRFWRGRGGGGELLLSTEIVNLISHRKKIKELTAPAIFFLNIINSTIH